MSISTTCNSHSIASIQEASIQIGPDIMGPITLYTSPKKWRSSCVKGCCKTAVCAYTAIDVHYRLRPKKPL